MPFLYIYWNPSKEIFHIPFIGFPVLWYSLFFALGFFIGYCIFSRLIRAYILDADPSITVENAKKMSLTITDGITFTMILCTIIGARLGHILFYEDIFSYLKNPLRILKTWEGGLASHGALIAIMIGLWIFSKSLSKKITIKVSYLTLLDLVAIPTALAAVFIRVGNFFNQEILGKVSNLPWSIIFLRPADGGLIMPRHPVQLYEAFAYLIIFFLLIYLFYQRKFFKVPGQLIGVFLVLVFSARFFLEYFKVEQSVAFNSDFLTMGQYLSIPIVLLGVFLFFIHRFYKKNGSK